VHLGLRAAARRLKVSQGTVLTAAARSRSGFGVRASRSSTNCLLHKFFMQIHGWLVGLPCVRRSRRSLGRHLLPLLLRRNHQPSFAIWKRRQDHLQTSNQPRLGVDLDLGHHRVCLSRHTWLVVLGGCHP